LIAAKLRTTHGCSTGGNGNFGEPDQKIGSPKFIGPLPSN
jgi:hypothetical protein